MFVRVWDKADNRYYKSMVYGLINIGCYEQAILFNPHTNCFELVDYFDDRENMPLKPLYECINCVKTDWVLYEKTYLLKLKAYFKANNFEWEIKRFHGYREVFDDFDFMLKIWREKTVPLSKTQQKIRENEDIHEWNYIRTQKDADEFMKLFAGFHDSTMDKLTYEEDYGKKQLNVIFDNSGWYGIAELCFEGLMDMHLRGFAENHSREIYSGCLIVRDGCIYWADDDLKEENIEYKGTWIKALNLKWKKIEKENEMINKNKMPIIRRK